ncbi:MAG: hypothetical protein N2Z22_00400 [Turneriella sp.]|nr:hypothetical protein [Turneriella sp.]
MCLWLIVVTGQGYALKLSLGYGIQANALLHRHLQQSALRQMANSAGKGLFGQGGTTQYSSLWQASFSDSPSFSPLVHVPELRLGSAWDSRWQVFATLGGLLPQTVSEGGGNYQLAESAQYSGANYAQCPLAAIQFVAPTGSGHYQWEHSTALRFWNFNLGAQYLLTAQKWAGVEFGILAELGFGLHAISSYTQFVGVRCTDGTPPPCAQIGSVRVVQGEQRGQSAPALGPHAALLVRYERPQQRWFAEIGLSATFLFVRWHTEGYTHFVAATTIAFAQTAEELGIARAQSFWLVLPALQFRCGVKL